MFEAGFANIDICRLVLMYLFALLHILMFVVAFLNFCRHLLSWFAVS